MIFKSVLLMLGMLSFSYNASALNVKSVDERVIAALFPSLVKMKEALEKLIAKRKGIEEALAKFVKQMNDELSKMQEQIKGGKNKDLAKTAELIKKFETKQKKAEEHINNQRTALAKVQKDMEVVLKNLKKEEMYRYKQFMNVLEATVKNAQQKGEEIDCIISMPSGGFLYLNPKLDITKAVSAELKKHAVDAQKTDS